MQSILFEYLNNTVMKRIFSTVLIAVFAALAFNSCETMDPEKDFSGTIYGFWVVDKLDVETSLSVNGETVTGTSTTDFSNQYCRLNLDTSNLATLWYGLKFDVEYFTYDNDAQKITFKEAVDVSNDGKAIVLLGVYDVELDGDKMIFRQPKAEIGNENLGASERATYTFHRAPNDEKPKETPAQ